MSGCLDRLPRARAAGVLHHLARRRSSCRSRARSSSSGSAAIARRSTPASTSWCRSSTSSATATRSRRTPSTSPSRSASRSDNVQVHVDGVLYLKVLNPERASYGVTDYHFAISQLAQTTLRSEIGKIDLDRTFEERMHINAQIVDELDKATEPWGIKVLRYEIKNITPPAGRARRDGEADARRAREARRHPDVGGRSATPPSTTPRARSSRSSRRPRRTSSSRSTRRRARRRPSWRSPTRRRRASARSPRRSSCRAASRRCSSAWPSSTSRSSGSSRRRRTRWCCRRTLPTSAR